MTQIGFGPSLKKINYEPTFFFSLQELRRSYHQSVNLKGTACCCFYLSPPKVHCSSWGNQFNYDSKYCSKFFHSMMKKYTAIITVCAQHALSLIYLFAKKPFSCANIAAVIVSHDLLKQQVFSTQLKSLQSMHSK